MPKKGGRLGHFTDLRGEAWQERGGGVFEGGLIPNAYYALLSVLHKNFIVKPQSPTLIS